MSEDKTNEEVESSAPKIKHYECHTECFVRTNGAEKFQRVTEGPDKGRIMQGFPSKVEEGATRQSVEKTAKKHFHAIYEDGSAATNNADIDRSMSETHNPGLEEDTKDWLKEHGIKFAHNEKLDNLLAKKDKEVKRLEKVEQAEIDKMNEDV